MRAFAGRSFLSSTGTGGASFRVLTAGGITVDHLRIAAGPLRVWSDADGRRWLRALSRRLGRPLTVHHGRHGSIIHVAPSNTVVACGGVYTLDRVVESTRTAS